MRKAPALALMLVLAGCAAAPRDDDFSRRPPPTSPSDLVSAEIAFDRLAQEKGQWTAFRETAAPNAIMFVPEMVQAQSWLKGRANPAQSVRWQAHNVFMSCDGTLGVTSGAAQWPDGRNGYFTTIWQRKEGSRGSETILKQWEWIVDAGGSLQAPMRAPDHVETRIADCKGTPTPKEILITGGTKDHRSGKSADQTLTWHVSTFGDGSRTLLVDIWDGSAMIPVIEDKRVAE